MTEVLLKIIGLRHETEKTKFRFYYPKKKHGGCHASTLHSIAATMPKTILLLLLTP